MNSKFCVYCGTPLEENAIFCVGCGNKTDAAQVSEQASGAGTAQYTTVQAPAYVQQNTAAPYPPQQTGAYNPQYNQAPGPVGGQYYQAPPPSGQNAYAYTPNSMNAGGYGQPKKGRGLLIGGIIGLVVLAVGIVIAVLMFGKPPKAKPDGGSASIPSSSTGSQQAEDAPQSDVKKDATLSDITGMWEGELQFTRMEGFDAIPSDELPENFDEMLEKMLSEPAPVTFEIREDGGWELYADVEMGMWFDSDDFSEAGESPLLLTKLKNGAFDVSYSEEVDEDDIRGTAAFSLSGTVHENRDGLYMEGVLLITAKLEEATVIEEAGFKVTFSGSEDTYEADDWDTNDDADSGSSSSVSDSAYLSTDERPDLGDFLWYLDGVYYDGVPDGSTPITDFSELEGGWKALFYYDPDNIANAFGYEFLNISLDGDADNVSMTLDWYMYVAENDNYDKSGEADTVLTGSLDQDGITAGSEGYWIFMYAFYEFGGKQYGLGYMELQSGEPTFVALIRP